MAKQSLQPIIVSRRGIIASVPIALESTDYQPGYVKIMLTDKDTGSKRFGEGGSLSEALDDLAKSIRLEIW